MVFGNLSCSVIALVQLSGGPEFRFLRAALKLSGSKGRSGQCYFQRTVLLCVRFGTRSGASVSVLFCELDYLLGDSRQENLLL